MGSKTECCSGKGCGNSVAINSSSSCGVIEAILIRSPSDTSIRSVSSGLPDCVSGDED